MQMKSIRMSSMEMNKLGRRLGSTRQMGRSEFPIEWSEKASLRRPLNRDPKGREGACQDVSGREHVRRIGKYRIPTGRVYLWFLRNGERFGGAETERAKEKGTEEESQR